MADPFWALAMAVAIVLLVAFVCATPIGHRPEGYPPGPPTLPFVGNIHQMPSGSPHKQLQKWAQEYGSIYSLIIGTKVMIVLSSDVAVKDLLDKRSARYSDRPDMHIGHRICSGSLRFLTMPYGPEWRNARRMTHALLNVNAAKAYVPYQDLESKQMLIEMLEQPHRFLENIRRYANSLTTSIVFGFRINYYDNERTKQLFEGVDEFTKIVQTSTAQLLDAYPVLQKLPSWLMSVSRKAKQIHALEKPFYLSYYVEVKEAIKAGTARPCFCFDMANYQKTEGFSDDQAGYISGSLLEAGSDTTSNTLYGFVQAMVLFPEVQKRAQEELDRIIGPNRLPTMEDEPQLQYIRGCLKESLRWMPTAILGFPHAPTMDDEYMGYHIPKGASIMLNVYTLHMDPVRYPNPRRFDPDRFKDDLLHSAESAASPDASKRDHFVFGAGRRICQGMHVVDRSLFLGISRLLWGFNIEPKIDPITKERTFIDSDRYTQGFICMPQPFEAEIRVRDSGREKILRDEWAQARNLLDERTEQWKRIP